MRVAMIGTGYVGLVSGACFSEFGHDVTCVDMNAERIEALRAGKIPIFEPGLEEVVARNAKAGRLHFTTDLERPVAEADAVFIAVGTPSRRGDGEADLTYVHTAAEQVARAVQGYTVVVTKSTVPVGTGVEVADIIRRTRPDADVDIASNPEFLREGAAIEDFMRPDRVVVGVDSERARGVMRLIYRPLFLNETPVLFTDLKTAELIKYAANTFLATKITFINQVADLCERVGVDVQDVARGIGLDRRIGGKFLHAGPGYGGSCFPKDTRALAALARRMDAPLSIVETVVSVNDARKRQMVDKILAACGGSVRGKRIGILGLTFKPNTDDMRESPSLEVVPGLVAAGAEVGVFDPEGMDEARKLLQGVTWCEDAYAVMEGAEALVIVTEWNQFRALDLGRARTLMREPLIIDLRNIYTLEEVRAAGFTYHSIGRPVVAAAAGSGMTGEAAQ